MTLNLFQNKAAHLLASFASLGFLFCNVSHSETIEVSEISNAMDSVDGIRPAGYNLAEATVTRVTDIEPKMGSAVLRFSGTAEKQTAKGHFGISSQPGQASEISFWVYLEEDANIKSIGLQVSDAKGESLASLTEDLVPGWQKLTFALTDENFEQAYPQEKHNNQLDFPLKSADIIWWAKDAGETEIIVDDYRLVRTIEVSDDPNKRYPLNVDILSSNALSVGEDLNLDLVIKNYNKAESNCLIYASLQINSANLDTLEPHNEHGFDHALIAHSKTYADGEVIATDTLVDGSALTYALTPYKKNYWTGIQQIVELDSVRDVTAMQWHNVHADKIWEVDVSASLDGENYMPVDELQDFDTYRKWGLQWFPNFQPFKAKFIKFDYHPDKATHLINGPSQLTIFDGPENDTYKIPDTGELIAEIREKVRVDSRSSTFTSFPLAQNLQPGSYLLSLRIKDDEIQLMKFHHIYVEPEPIVELSKEKSRIGMNTSSLKYMDSLKNAGIGWIRFENSKWAFCNPEPGRFAFDGSVQPWKVDFDNIFKSYYDAGFGIIPFTMVTPVYASNAPESVTKVKDLGGFPPKNYDDYKEYMFQLTARYGKNKVPEERLLTEDKVSGLGYIDYFEIWNEPNLNPKRTEKIPTWGPWRGTMDEFWPLFRKGYEGIVDAWPEAIISSPGMAGATSEMMHQLYEYQYSDGKRPIDFTDIINVHYYSGPADPEVAGDDYNSGEHLSATFPVLMRQLSEWRDQYRPNAEIWLTETGYDTGGPIASTERKQAAKLVRIIILSLQNGIDKVFVYRESGSTPTKHAAAGIHRNDGSRKPAWFSLATMTRQIYDAEPLLQLPSEDPEVYSYAWKRKDGRILITAWTLDGTAKLNVDLGKATVVDSFGHEYNVERTDDLLLTDYPLYININKNTEALALLFEEAQTLAMSDKVKREMEAKANAYLYDFGDIGTNSYHNFGEIRKMEPVAKDLMYNEERGYGFQVPASANQFKHYISKKHIASKYNVVFNKDTVFQFDAEPGTYQIDFNGASPRGSKNPEKLIIIPEGGEVVEMQLASNNTKVGSTTITTTGGPVLIKATGKIDLRWINAIPLLN